MEEKYKGQMDALDSDSESESEDEGELATEQLDSEIMATLSALRSKDPSIYNKEHNFYAPDHGGPAKQQKDKSKPLHLRDYHRQNLLNGHSESKDTPVRTHAEKQDDLRRELVGQMHDEAPDGDDAGSDDDGFMIRKPGQKREAPTGPGVELDVEQADQDPENYLNNFMASRSWVPSRSSKFQPFESDDEDEDDRADNFEQAYNMRFEDPSKANEKLLTHSREAADKYSVRRDEVKGRKKGRQEERDRKDAEKAKREEEKSRLRRLKIEEAQEKWIKLKDAAGLRKQNLPDDKLLEFLEKGFEEGDWDKQMQRLLGEAYYDDKDEDVSAGMNMDRDRNQSNGKKSSKAKKPSWEDDIDIGDIVPDFDEEEERQRGNIVLSDEEVTGQVGADAGVEEVAVDKPDQETQKSSRKRQNRIARQKIAELVDTKIVDDELPVSKHTGFRYREGSPTTFGLSARDILMADDSQLNSYAGLKKLASYRDQQKKERDTRKLGKKARLRKWRRETFGKDEDEVVDGKREGEDADFEKWFNESRGAVAAGGTSGKQRKRKAEHLETNGGEEIKTKHKKKRKKSKSADTSEGGVAVA